MHKQLTCVSLQEAFLLAASGASAQLPYTLEQLQQMQAAALLIAASKDAK